MIKNAKLEPQNIQMEYKNYTYPWDQKRKEKLAECICAFMNTLGGTIMIGIKQTKSFKNTVVGHPYSGREIEQLKKDVTTIVEKISVMAVANSLVRVDFVPVIDVSSARSSGYVIKIVVKKGWLSNLRELYQYNGNYFFRTTNEVKSYN